MNVELLQDINFHLQEISEMNRQAEESLWFIRNCSVTAVG